MAVAVAVAATSEVAVADGAAQGTTKTTALAAAALDISTQHAQRR
jgi:hypothetical protein